MHEGKYGIWLDAAVLLGTMIVTAPITITLIAYHLIKSIKE